MAVEKHSHCIMCGVSIPPDEILCSEKCREAYTKKRKKMIRTQQIYLLIVFAVIAVFIFTKFFNYS